MTEPAPDATAWWQRSWVLPAVVIAGVAIRILLLPTPGYVGDINQFVDWVRHIAHDGLSHAYDQQLSFGPVMVIVWWVLGLVDPTLATALNSADPAVRIVMKLPAVAADLGIAALAWYALRRTPGWATAAVAIVLLHPAIWFVSAWWGTYDSVYAAFGVAAFVLAVRGRDRLAVVALVLALMTKPQALPLAVPFAAWFLARAGWGMPGSREVGGAIGRLALLAVVGLGTLAVVWLPFVAANGPANYLAGLAAYQGGEFYGILSLRAWNPWWVIQQVLGRGQFVLDSNLVAGPVTFRLVGYLVTGLLMLVIALCVIRRPSPRMLALGLATAALVAFEFLTTMHERYAFAVLPMLVFILDNPRVRWVIAAFGAVFFLNLVWAAQHNFGLVVPFAEWLSVAGAAINVGCVVVLLLELVAGSRRPEPASAINDSVLEAGASAPPNTSAGSAAATSGA